VNPRELEKAVEELAAVCDECRSLHRHIGNKHHDLNNVARKASRYSDPPARLRDGVKEAKAALQKQREIALEHLEDKHREKSSGDR
jgi:hypothetical protein